MTLAIRPAIDADHHAIAALLLPIAAAGETLALARDADAAAVLAYWAAPGGTVYVAEIEGQVVGSYRLCANRAGGGSHVANAGYAVAVNASGRGVGRAMGKDSLRRAKAAGFTALQFNFVVSTNLRAVVLWESLGLEIVGRLPGAFIHPTLGAVDALVMYRTL